jgi:Ca2+/Na+ antiporter
MELNALALPLFAFYLLVFCNFTPEVIGCRMQHLLRKNMVAKHLLSVLLLFFLIVLAQEDLSEKNIPYLVAFSVLVYAWFIMTTRSPLYVTFAVLVLLLIVYVIGAVKKRYAGDPSQDAYSRKLEMAQRAMTTIALLISIVGFVLYFLEKRKEYGDAFDWKEFIAGTNRCKNFTPSEAVLLI